MAKIFISHSSKDKELVDLFKNLILNAGLGILDRDIAYTSAPETGVPTGESIPQYIKRNIADSDVVFFMVSENYRKSEICLNEMGAAWALDKRVKPMLLYNVAFESIGWLYHVNLCARIDDPDRLDELRDEFIERYGSQTKTVVWNRKKDEFIEAISTPDMYQNALPVAVVAPLNADELGLLDYREAFDNNLKMVNQIMETLTNAMMQWNTKISKHVQQLKSMNVHMSNVSQVKTIMKSSAKDMNQLSDAIDENSAKLSEHFKTALENAMKIHKYLDSATYQDVKDENRRALTELIQTLILSKDQTRQGKNAFLGIPNMEQSQIAAKKRLTDSFSALIVVFDECITKATELLKA